MRNYSRSYNRSKIFKILSLILILGLPLLFYSTYPRLLNAQGAGEVNIVIKNKTYEFSGGITKPDQPITIVLKNKDDIEHGFTSKLLEEFPAEVESRGVLTFGKGIKGVHVAPGAMVRIHFTPTRPGSFSFQCDIHPSMKGELFVLSVEAI